jgi:hypothetical protein
MRPASCALAGSAPDAKTALVTALQGHEVVQDGIRAAELRIEQAAGGMRFYLVPLAATPLSGLWLLWVTAPDATAAAPAHPR